MPDHPFALRPGRRHLCHGPRILAINLQDFWRKARSEILSVRRSVQITEVVCKRGIPRSRSLVRSSAHRRSDQGVLLVPRTGSGYSRRIERRGKEAGAGDGISGLAGVAMKKNGIREGTMPYRHLLKPTFFFSHLMPS